MMSEAIEPADVCQRLAKRIAQGRNWLDYANIHVLVVRIITQRLEQIDGEHRLSCAGHALDHDGLRLV